MFTTNPYSMGTKDAGSLAMLQALLGGQGGMPQQGGQMNSLAQAQTAPLVPGQGGEDMSGALGGALQSLGQADGQAMLGRQRNAMQKELLGITDPEQAEALRQRLGGMNAAMGFLGR